MIDMFEFYLDTTDLQQLARFNKSIPLKGITTNPSILAKSGVGLKDTLINCSKILGPETRFHVQTVSKTTQEIINEAEQLNALPYDIVVKVPTTEIGLAAIKELKHKRITVLATAIYSVQQGFLAALCGADYLAPYVNRIDAMGVSGINVVDDIQLLLKQHGLASKLLPASFKNTQQVMDVLKLGVDAITLPVDIADQLISHPAVPPAVKQFECDWQVVFGDKLSFES